MTISAVAIVAAGLLVAPGTATASPPAPAPTPPPVVTAQSADTTLSTLHVVSGTGTALAPTFSAANHYYQIVNYSGSTTLQVTPTDSGATATVTLNGAAQSVNGSGQVALSLTRGRNEVAITVTGTDASTQLYHVAIWYDAAPLPEIVSVIGGTSSVYGGGRVILMLRDGYLPSPCNMMATINGLQPYPGGLNIDGATGLTQLPLILPPSTGYQAASYDIVVNYSCQGPSATYTSKITATNAITYVNNFQVTSVDVPTPVTMASQITVHGVGVGIGTVVSFFVTKPDGSDPFMYGPTSFGTSDTDATLMLSFGNGEAKYAGSGPRVLVAALCTTPGVYTPATCQTKWSRPITWQAPAPSDLSFTPVYGTVAGGTKIRLRGRYLVSANAGLVVKVGDQTIPSNAVTPVTGQIAGLNYSDLNAYSSAYDTVEFPAPAMPAPGPVKISVTTTYGTATAPGTYTYVARPAISSISPASVSADGGSTITLTGSAFGTTGKPTVIVNGTKSPYVNRVSDTQLTAVVPTGQSPGSVSVQVSSAQGGGVSDPASLTLAAPGAAPVITQVSPSTAAAGDSVTITGSGFGPPGTPGVSVDGVWAKVTASTTGSVTFQVPTLTDFTGVKTVQVGAVTGLATQASALTVLPPAGISAVTPDSIPSYASGGAAQITLTGGGFGTSGTVKVGSAAAVPYTSSSNGTVISGVTVPTGTAGSLTVTVTPQSGTAQTATVRVVGPQITYLGSDPYSLTYASTVVPGPYITGLVLDVPAAGGSAVRIQGAGFGGSGVLQVGSTTVTPTTWADGLITFIAPPQAAGVQPVTISPTGTSLTATRAAGLRYDAAVPGPAIATIASDVDLGHGDRRYFDPAADLNGSFTITGANLAGANPANTRVIVSVNATTELKTITPTSVSPTSITFQAPRDFTSGDWKWVQVVTDAGSAVTNYGLYYLAAGPTLTVSPWYGLCLRTSQSATGGITDDPAIITIDSSAGAFGGSGTATIDGTTLPTTTWNANQVVIDMSQLSADLASPWGAKSIVLTPSGGTLPALSVGFTCAVAPTVTTTVNSGTADVTVPAGTSYTPSFTTAGIIGTFTVPAAGYEYVTKADFDAHGFDRNVTQGVPVAAGDYEIRVSMSQATYDTSHYVWLGAPSPVHVTITGTPVTITAHSVGGAAFTYHGQLASPDDFTYSATTTTDPITDVTWEYRNSSCAADPTAWQPGLPKDVAISQTSCGGDGTTRVGWDVRVKTFAMTAGGPDRAMYYIATSNPVHVQINPAPLTVGAIRADRVYDGTNTATYGTVTLGGALPDDDVRLNNSSGSGTFADTSPGVNKPVTLAADMTLTGASAGDYALLTPRPAIVGTITKADATLALAASRTSVLLTQNPSVTITPTVLDSRTGNAPPGGAGLSPVVLTSQTPSVCTVSGMTVTAIAGGTCTVTGSQAASANYNASKSATDASTTNSAVTFTVFPAQRTITVIADDLTVGQGDTVMPTSQITGLFDGDAVNGITYAYYSGNTLLGSVPSAQGTYRVVPSGGTLSAASSAVYTNPSAINYVEGTLTITPAPPTITGMSPGSGPVAGNTLVTITGTLLDTVRAVQIGSYTIPAGSFTVSPDGTTLTFTTPAAGIAGVASVALLAGSAEADSIYTYVEPEPTTTPTIPSVPNPAVTPTPSASPTPTPSASPTPTPSPTTSQPVKINLNLNLSVDSPLVGAQAVLSGGGLKPGSKYVLTMNSTPIVVAQGTTNTAGSFRTTIKMPGKACVKGGLHHLALTGVAPSGATVEDTSWLVLDDSCSVRTVTTGKPANSTVTLRTFIFPYLSARLVPTAQKVLRALSGTLNETKAITITGYTQTGKQSNAAKKANRALALRRANAVRVYLQKHGVKRPIKVVGAGGVNPADKKHQMYNRRVVITVKY